MGGNVKPITLLNNKPSLPKTGKYVGGGVVIMLEQFSFLKNWNTEKFQSEEKQEGGEEFLYIPKIKMV